ncbi:ArsR/SmtB family transcription factor [Chitinimonas sp. BJB300]|uniref:ArsR/SmtB family transcription factor n=1 Tax=Chitinimonas sp. BJB300 TaxID=1559339 RepID=UPI000C10BFFF|nr:metalloregulator ArsR/SmtB family transcription factor [Chitinimonas sp. BJB300]PHV12896.1 ArsR family transcriptional regulator [Chitinimonas sp. BJB300]TSJ88465.1 helix-turn-helix transcriptional regulator [Chitinimonas sp. BJB300]
MREAVLTQAQLDTLCQAADAAATLLKPLGNADRLLLLCQLVPGEKSVSVLEANTGIRQPSLSQQLGVLRNEKLVSTRRDGKYIYYSLISDEAMRVLALMYEIHCSKGEKGPEHAD